MANDDNLYPPREAAQSPIPWLIANLRTVLPVLGLAAAGIWAWYDVSSKANAAPSQIAALQSELGEQRKVAAAASSAAETAQADYRRLLERAAAAEAKLDLAMQEQSRLAAQLQSLAAKQSADHTSLLNQIQAERQK
jgi:hypothetical protein